MKINWKRIATVFLVLGALAGGWFLYFLYGPKQPLEDVLPKDAVLFARLSNPVDHWQKGAQSEFWKQVSAIDVTRVLAHNKVPPPMVSRYEHMRKQLTNLFSNPLIQKFLGREVAIAVYQEKPITDDVLLQDPMSAYSFLVIARPLPSAMLLETFSRLSSQWTQDATTRVESYRGHPIVHLNIKDKNHVIKYTRIKDLYVFSQDSGDTLHKAIDVFRRRLPPMRFDDHHKFAMSHSYPRSQGLLYISGRVNGMPSGFETYALSFMPGPISKYKLSVGFGARPVAPAYKQLLACDPKANVSSAFVPSGVIGYQWSGCYDFKDLAQQLKDQLQNYPDAARSAGKLRKSMEKRMGFRISETLLPLLGAEAGGYLTDVDIQGLFPYPRLLTFVKVNDVSKTSQLLGRIVKSPLGLVQKEDYGQIGIHYLSLPLGGNMDPGYCFVGNYLLAATSRQLLKKSIDTYQDQTHSLRNDKMFGSLGLNTAKAQSIGYFKVAEIARRLRGLLDWGNKQLSSQVSMASVYRQEGQRTKKKLADNIRSKEEELRMAVSKMKEYRSAATAQPSAEEEAAMRQTVDNFAQQVQALRDEIRTENVQQKEIDDLMATYDVQSENAKLFMFNSQQVLVPILKGLETINAQGFKVMVNGKAIETELFLK